MFIPSLHVSSDEFLFTACLLSDILLRSPAQLQVPTYKTNLLQKSYLKKCRIYKFIIVVIVGPDAVISQFWCA
jgi:hypothetical protein